MLKKSARAIIVVPGLFESLAIEAEPDWPTAYPALYRLIARGRVNAVPDLGIERRLLNAFGWRAQKTDIDPDLAELTAAYDFPDQPWRGEYLRCDPVHLRADAARLRLADPAHLMLSDAEAHTVLAELRQNLPDIEIISSSVPHRWYIRFPRKTELRTTSPSAARECAIDQFLPAGNGANQLHKLMNEMQMVLHQSPVNEQREDASRPAVNSVWLWGGGSPIAPFDCAIRTAFGNDVTVASLASYCALDWHETDSPEPVFEAIARGEDVIVCLDAPTGQACEIERRAGELATTPANFESRWAAPLLKKLRRGSISELLLMTHGAELVVRAADVWKVWRRTDYFKPDDSALEQLAAHLEGEQQPGRDGHDPDY